MSCGARTLLAQSSGAEEGCEVCALAEQFQVGILDCQRTQPLQQAVVEPLCLASLQEWPVHEAGIADLKGQSNWRDDLGLL